MCALATAADEGPLCSLMACQPLLPLAQTHTVRLLTSANSQKYRNLYIDERASLLFDTRHTTRGAGGENVQAVTAAGVYVYSIPEKQHAADLAAFLDAYPHLALFADDDPRVLNIHLHTITFLSSSTEARFFHL